MSMTSRTEDVPRHERLRSEHVALLIGLVGLLLTGGVTWTAWTLNRDNNHRLLVDQTKQASSVISASILGIESPLSTALKIAEVGGDNSQQFDLFMKSTTGPGLSFISASLWKVQGDVAHTLGSVGAAPDLAPGSSAAEAVVSRAVHTKTFVVDPIRTSRLERVGYALGDPGQSDYVVYAERQVPADRLASVEANSAFAELNFATYIGP